MLNYHAQVMLKKNDQILHCKKPRYMISFAQVENLLE